MKRWITIHRHTANPRASLIRSLGVSYAVQMVSLWGLLRRTVTTTSAPINIVRRMMASIRSPIGIVDDAVSTLGGTGCCGLALIASPQLPLTDVSIILGACAVHTLLLGVAVPPPSAQRHGGRPAPAGSGRRSRLLCASS